MDMTFKPKSRTNMVEAPMKALRPTRNLFFTRYLSIGSFFSSINVSHTSISHVATQIIQLIAKLFIIAQLFVLMCGWYAISDDILKGKPTSCVLRFSRLYLHPGVM